MHRILLCTALAIVASFTSLRATVPVLIVDGRNNHDWRTTTNALRATLESTGLFTVTLSTAPEWMLPSPPHAPSIPDDDFAQAKARYDAAVKAAQPALDAQWLKWRPEFSKFAAVILNYNGPQWPEAMRRDFVEYVRGGGGVLLVHAANNAFADWPEFNDMIGLGWRKGGFGTCLVIDPATGKAAECCADDATGHGSKHPFVVTTRAPEHPVLRGLPGEWLHAKDELYHHLRGPARNVTILASAFSDEKQHGSGRHEPVLYETAFGKGRVLVTTMGHCWNGDTEFDSLGCVGFQTIVARGVEYLATGKVTLGTPANFPAKDKVSVALPHNISWNANQ